MGTMEAQHESQSRCLGQLMEGQPRILSWEEGGFQVGKGEVEEKTDAESWGKVREREKEIEVIFKLLSSFKGSDSVILHCIMVLEITIKQSVQMPMKFS